MRSELAAFGEIASHLANPLVLIGFALLLVFGVHRALQEYQDQNKALTEAVQALAKKQDKPGVQEALAALAEGQTQAAKAIFAKTVEAKSAEGAAADREAAEAARHLGALAFLDNTEEALRWYRRAVELDPANADAWNNLGHLYDRTGQLDQAEAACCHARDGAPIDGRWRYEGLRAAIARGTLPGYRSTSSSHRRAIW